MNMRTARNLLLHELIGLRVEITRSSCKHTIGMKGRIVDETKNTFLVEGDDGIERTFPKRTGMFRFRIGGKVVDVDGRKICYRPEERPKKVS